MNDNQEQIESQQPIATMQEFYDQVQIIAKQNNIEFFNASCTISCHNPKPEFLIWIGEPVNKHFYGAKPEHTLELVLGHLSTKKVDIGILDVSPEVAEEYALRENPSNCQNDVVFGNIVT